MSSRHEKSRYNESMYGGERGNRTNMSVADGLGRNMYTSEHQKKDKSKRDKLKRAIEDAMAQRKRNEE